MRGRFRATSRNHNESIIPVTPEDRKNANEQEKLFYFLRHPLDAGYAPGTPEGFFPFESTVCSTSVLRHPYLGHAVWDPTDKDLAVPPPAPEGERSLWNPI